MLVEKKPDGKKSPQRRFHSRKWKLIYSDRKRMKSYLEIKAGMWVGSDGKDG